MSTIYSIAIVCLSITFTSILKPLRDSVALSSVVGNDVPINIYFIDNSRVFSECSQLWKVEVCQGEKQHLLLRIERWDWTGQENLLGKYHHWALSLARSWAGRAHFFFIIIHLRKYPVLIHDTGGLVHFIKNVKENFAAPRAVHSVLLSTHGNTGRFLCLLSFQRRRRDPADFEVNVWLRLWLCLQYFPNMYQLAL